MDKKEITIERVKNYVWLAILFTSFIIPSILITILLYFITNQLPLFIINAILAPILIYFYIASTRTIINYIKIYDKMYSPQRLSKTEFWVSFSIGAAVWLFYLAFNTIHALGSENEIIRWSIGSMNGVDTVMALVMSLEILFNRKDILREKTDNPQ